MSRLVAVVAVLSLAACPSRAPVEQPVEQPLENAEAKTNADAVFIDARTLLVAGPDAATPMARIARHHAARLRFEDAALRLAEPEDGGEIVPVAEARGERVRARISTRDARLLLWLDRTDLVKLIAHETGVASGPGDAFAVAGKPGVRLLPGTQLLEVKDTGDPGRRAISCDEDGLLVSGEIAASALDELWIPAADRPDPPNLHHLDAYAGIRSAPDEDAPMVASTSGYLSITQLGEADGWVEVETLGPQVIARGFVSGAKIDQPDRSGRGGDHVVGFGYGTPQPPHLEVPAGACLYDGDGGALVGLATATRTRVAKDLSENWYGVVVESAWGDVWVAVRDAIPDDERTIELCADPTTLTAAP